MKISLRIILINMLVFILVIGILEFVAYKKYYNKVQEIMNLQSRMLSKKQQLKYTFPTVFNIEEYSPRFRTYIGSHPTKRPVLFVGCSYTVGEGLKNTQKVDYKVSKMTGRTTYSRAISGGGPQMIYYQFKNGSIKKEVPDAQFIIYTYVPDHAYKPLEYRMSYLSTRLNLRYELENGELKEIKPLFPILYSSFLVKEIQNYLDDQKVKKLNDEGKTFEPFNAIMKELIVLSKKEYPNSTFIILEYPDHYVNLNDRVAAKFTPKEKEYLKSLGYTVINAEKLTGKNLYGLEYRTADNDHPNEKAWDVIVPKLVKQLNL